MKRIMFSIMVLILIVIFSYSCEDFLDYVPKGTLSDELLKTPERIDQLVTAAYAELGNGYEKAPYCDMWTWGSVRSDDAYKGGGSINDGGMNPFEQFYPLLTNNAYTDYVWIFAYEAISRANEALRKMEELSEEEYPLKKQRQAECRFLRGHFHFVLKILFKFPVYADHEIPKSEIKNVSNSEYTNEELWNKIAADFQFAMDNLPETQKEIGRATKFAAAAYLAKLRLYQAYEQDEQHNMTNINLTRLQEVVDLSNIVINSGKYGLHDDYAKNFLLEYENGVESVFAIQYSIDDGTPTGRLNIENALNYSAGPGYGCCWFHIPSQNLVNAFKTGPDGLPMFSTYNDTEMKDSADFRDNNVDPRLDHTVGIPGHPFKYDPEFIYDLSWARTPQLYGPYSSMKEVQHPNCNCVRKVLTWFFSDPKNFDLIRYNDVLLWKAEALIELGRHDEALPIINQIRERAKNSTEWLKCSNGDYISNYYIDTYKPGVNCSWTLDFAREAFRYERRMEFSMECWRFFDLVRWGIAAETLNDYFEVEKNRHSYLNQAQFRKNRDEYLPIPQTQIEFTQGLYTQNYGW